MASYLDNHPQFEMVKQHVTIYHYDRIVAESHQPVLQLAIRCHGCIMKWRLVFAGIICAIKKESDGFSLFIEI